MSNTSILDRFSNLRRQLGLMFSNGLKGSGLGRQQMLTLFRLIEAPCSMSELSAFTQADPAATTRTVGALEEAQFIKRSADPKDGRRSIIQLTAKGRAKAKIALETRSRIAALVAEALSESEQIEFCRLLEKVAASLLQERTSEVEDV